MNQVQQINIDNVLKEKSPRLHKILPRFIINWLKKTLHEKDINQILRELEDKHEIEFINNGLKKLQGLKQKKSVLLKKKQHSKPNLIKN